MSDIQCYKLSKLFVSIAIIYMLWFKYAYRESGIILYGTALLSVFFMLIDLLQTQKDITKVIPAGVMINIIMCIYSILTGIFTAQDQTLLMSTFKTYLAFSIVCMIVCYVSTEENSLSWLLNVLIITNIICAIYVIFHGYYFRGYGYVIGPNNNPNSLGHAMDMGLFCLALKSNKANNQFKLLFMSLGLLFIYIIIGCGSRKCLFAATIIIAFWLIPLIANMWRKASPFNRVLLLIGIIVAMIAVYYYFNNIYSVSYSYKRMQALGDEEDIGSHNRILMYKYAIDCFLNEPLFGIGLNQYRVLSPFHSYAHSTYAEALADWGVVGCLFYFMPVIVSGVELIKGLWDYKNHYVYRIIFAFWAMEIFLGIGQIWFYSLSHMISWTIIFYTIKNLKPVQKPVGRQCKYVKS